LEQAMFDKFKTIANTLTVLVVLLLGSIQAHAQGAPNFTANFNPSTIGSGSDSSLTYTIENVAGVPITGISFSNTLPAGLTISATPALTTDCPLATISAPAGGGTIGFAGGGLGNGQTCTTSVNVTPAAPSTYTNAAINLTSSAGSAQSSAQDLMVVTTQPGFTKSFAPASVGLGETTTITYTIDNPVTAGNIISASFSENLPAALEIASPANAVYDCPDLTNTVPFFTANTGERQISFSFNGFNFAGYFIPPDATCEFSVDVKPLETGIIQTTSSSLSANGTSVGAASANLEVRAHVAGTPLLTKEFIDDPVPAGNNATLEFTLKNTDRNFAATGLAFTDDLSAMLSGATMVGGPLVDPCGAGSSVSGTSTIVFTGGVLAVEETCTFSVSVQIPNGAGAGSYLNTTSTVAGTIDGNPVVGAAASNSLTVTASASFTIDAVYSPATTTPGVATTIIYSLDNSAGTAQVQNLTFEDLIANQLVGATFVYDGGSSTCGGNGSAVADFTGTQSGVQLFNGSIAAGATCEVRFSVTPPAGTLGDTYTSTTSAPTATVSGNPVSASPASATLTVVAALDMELNKEFAADTVSANGSVDLTFRLKNDSEDANATEISFNDPLSQLDASARFDSVVSNGCSGSLSGIGTDTFGMTNGALLAGEECSITIAVQLTAATTGLKTSTTSDVTASANGATAAVLTGTAATDTIIVADNIPVTFTKSFLDDPVLPGGAVTMRYTISNPASNGDGAASLTFNDALQTTLPGISITGSPSTDVCGSGSVLIATGNNIIVVSGTLAPGADCTFDISLLVPAGASSGNYPSASGTISGVFGATPFVGGTANDVLAVEQAVLNTSKSYSPATILAGESTTVTYTLENPSLTELTGINFNDDMTGQPNGLSVSNVQDSGCSGSVGSNSISSSATSGITGTNLAISPGATCTISLQLSTTAGTTPGDYGSTTSAFSGTTGGLVATGGPVSASFSVLAANAPSFSKEFLDDPVGPGGMSRLRFTINNPASGANLANLAFTDDLNTVIEGMTASNFPSAPCGAASSISGSSVLAFTGGSLPPGEICIFDVDISVPASATAGSHGNSTSALSSSGLFVQVAASDSIMVEAAPAFSKSFLTSAITVGEVSVLEFTIDNSAASLMADNLNFTDNMPTAITVADPANINSTCGTVSAPVGGSVVSLASGRVRRGASCTIAVNVTSNSVGTHVNTTGDLTSTLGNSGTATDTLDVQAQLNGALTIVQHSSPDGSYGFSSATAALNFTLVTTGGIATSTEFSLPAGTYTLAQSRPTGHGNTELSCSDSDSSGDLTTGVLTVNLAAGEQVVCTYRSIGTDNKTVETINSFLSQRTDLILSNQPDRSRRINRLKQGAGTERLAYAPGQIAPLNPFAFDPMSIGSGSYQIATSLDQVSRAATHWRLATGTDNDNSAVHVRRRFDVWFEGSFTHFDGSGDSGGHFGIAYLGADYLLTPDILVGALIQYDTMQDSSTALAYSIEGKGWMLSPYLTARVAPNLYFDGRVAWGKSVNDISPFNTYTDQFDTERWLINASLTGEYTRGNWNIRPNVSLSYMEETQETYLDSMNVTIPSQTVSRGQLRLGPNFSTSFMNRNDYLVEPFFTLDAIYSHADTSGVLIANQNGPDNGWRGRLEAGLTMANENGSHFSFTGSYDGIGQNDYEAWGLTLELGYEF